MAAVVVGGVNIFGGSGTYYLEARAYADAYSGTWTLTAELL